MTAITPFFLIYVIRKNIKIYNIIFFNLSYLSGFEQNKILNDTYDTFFNKDMAYTLSVGTEAYIQNVGTEAYIQNVGTEAYIQNVGTQIFNYSPYSPFSNSSYSPRRNLKKENMRNMENKPHKYEQIRFNSVYSRILMHTLYVATQKRILYFIFKKGQGKYTIVCGSMHNKILFSL